MTQPTPYARSFSFTDFAAAHPTDPLPGTSVDAELNAVAETLAETLANLALIQRDDTKLANGSVHPDALDADVLELLATFSRGIQGVQGEPGQDGVGTGTVTSVGLALPASLFDVTAAITSAGTLTGSLKVQAANRLFAGPATGADAVPTMRAMVAADIPVGIVAPSKLADVATATVCYRKTAGTGAPEWQTLAQLKTDLGLTGTNSGDQAVPTEITDAEGWTGTNTAKFISPRRLFSLAANVTVAYAATVTLDLATGINFKIGALTGALLLANPTNAKSGQSGKIKLPQDATGGRIISYGSNWRFASGKAVSGVLSTAANSIDHLSYFVEDDGTITATLAKAFS